ncbi:MAG TPA: D-alanine--D-alanine ligase family protein [Rubrobacter sp.]|nr:D-alanine--D-alanine ligase family protein [Rubrobacter sp.]
MMVVFGGRSGEHEVSLASARAIAEALGKSGRHEVVPVGITREGRWISSGEPMRELESRSGYLADGSPEVSVPPASAAEKLPAGLGSVDVVFPVLHGPYGEDGTIQGMLELAGIPYVGSGVLGSAAGMDKPTMKKIFAHHGLPQVGWVAFTRKQWEEDREGLREEIERLGYPCFVKPANLGSSVGIRKAEGAGELGEAVDEAARHDRRIIVEEGIDAREIEVSVLGNEAPDVSVPGEIVIKNNDFYDYEAKYVEGGMELIAPAPIPDETTREIRRIARAAFEAIDAAGMARVDFFLERGTDRLLLNEINTIPGFTPTSVYAELWATSGLPYEELLDRLVQLALERHG